jgi:hypothetical protein
MSSIFSVPVAEYEHRRSSFGLCEWINQKLEEMRKTGHFDELYFERSDPRSNLKKLIEEAIPLSRLGLYLSTPGSEVYLTCLAGNQNYDAYIEITGFDQRIFKVEVTTTENRPSTLRRQALSRLGHVPLTGPISRSGREITIPDETEMVCANEEDDRCVNLMFERMRHKVESGRYGGDTAILVFFTEFRAIDPKHRARLAFRTNRYLLETQANVAGVYYCYTADYSIDSARGGSTPVAG